MKLLAVLALLGLLVTCALGACGNEPAPTPDLVALREQIVQEVLAELTAGAPTATQTPRPTRTAAPTATAAPSNTATPTATATRTPAPPTETQTVTAVPTKPRPVAKPTASPAAKPTSAPVVSAAPRRAGTIAFAAYEPAVAAYTLYTVTADDALHVIANHVHQPDISPDGQVIVGDGAGGGKEDIWAVVISSGEWRHLTNYLDDHYPTWSGDGQRIGFSSSRQGDGVYRLYIDDILIDTDRSDFVVGDYPVLLATGAIIFAGCDYGWGTGSRCGIWVASGGTTPQRLTDNSLDVPTDANASNVLFLRPQGDNWDIYRVGYSGGAPVPVFPSPARDGPAALSPDGKSLAFLSDRSGRWTLYTASVEGGEEAKVVELPPGVDMDRAPYPWWSERISWGPGPIFPTPTATLSGTLLPAPRISFPVPDDTVSTTRATPIQWSWSRALGSNESFVVRFWHGSDPPVAVAATTTGTQLDVWFGLTDAYRRYADDFYYLDVVVVDVDSQRVLSESTPIRVKTDPNK